MYEYILAELRCVIFNNKINLEVFTRCVDIAENDDEFGDELNSNENTTSITPLTS